MTRATAPPPQHFHCRPHGRHKPRRGTGTAAARLVQHHHHGGPRHRTAAALHHRHDAGHGAAPVPPLQHRHGTTPPLQHHRGISGSADTAGYGARPTLLHRHGAASTPLVTAQHQHCSAEERCRCCVSCAREPPCSCSCISRNHGEVNKHCPQNAAIRWCKIICIHSKSAMHKLVNR